MNKLTAHQPETLPGQPTQASMDDIVYHLEHLSLHDDSQYDGLHGPLVASNPYEVGNPDNTLRDQDSASPSDQPSSMPTLEVPLPSKYKFISHEQVVQITELVSNQQIEDADDIAALLEIPEYDQAFRTECRLLIHDIKQQKAKESAQLANELNAQVMSEAARMSSAQREKLYQDIKQTYFNGQDYNDITKALSEGILPSLQQDLELKLNFYAMQFSLMQEGYESDSNLNFLHMLILEIPFPALTIDLLKDAAEATGLSLACKTGQGLSLAGFYNNVYPLTDDVGTTDENTFRTELLLALPEGESRLGGGSQPIGLEHAGGIAPTNADDFFNSFTENQQALFLDLAFSGASTIDIRNMLGLACKPDVLNKLDALITQFQSS